MTDTSKSRQEVRQVIQQYIDGSRSGDVTLLKSIFHPQAQMSGYLQGELGIGPPDPFFEAVTNNPSPQSSGAPYSAEISHIDVSGRVATATLLEEGFLGMDFTDYFHLIEEEGRWSIISKVFMQS